MSIPRDGLRQIAIAGLLIALAIFLPWLVLAATFTYVPTRFAWHAWRRASVSTTRPRDSGAPLTRSQEPFE